MSRRSADVLAAVGGDDRAGRTEALLPEEKERYARDIVRQDDVAKAGELLDELLKAVSAPGADDNAGTVGREAARGRLADPGRGAGDTGVRPFTRTFVVHRNRNAQEQQTGVHPRR